MAEVGNPKAAGSEKSRAQHGKRGRRSTEGRRGDASPQARRKPGAGERYGKTVKKSVTLRESVVEQIEARTGVRGFSEFLDAAAERHLALLKAQEIVDDHVARHGEFTPEERAEAEAAWRGE